MTTQKHHLHVTGAADAKTVVRTQNKVNGSWKKVTETIVHTQQKLSLQTDWKVMRSHLNGSTLSVPRSCRDWRAERRPAPAPARRHAGDSGGGVSVGVTRQTYAIRRPHTDHTVLFQTFHNYREAMSNNACLYDSSFNI